MRNCIASQRMLLYASCLFFAAQGKEVRKWTQTSLGRPRRIPRRSLVWEGRVIRPAIIAWEPNPNGHAQAHAVGTDFCRPQAA